MNLSTKLSTLLHIEPGLHNPANNAKEIRELRRESEAYYYYI